MRCAIGCKWPAQHFPHEDMNLKNIHTGMATEFRAPWSLKTRFFICHPTQSVSPELGGEVLWVRRGMRF